MLERLHPQNSVTFILNQIMGRAWRSHVIRMGEIRNAYTLVGEPDRKRPLQRLRVHGSIILKLIAKEI
jgi:hypothetical protein